MIPENENARSAPPEAAETLSDTMNLLQQKGYAEDFNLRSGAVRFAGPGLLLRVDE